MFLLKKHNLLFTQKNANLSLKKEEHLVKNLASKINACPVTAKNEKLKNKKVDIKYDFKFKINWLEQKKNKKNSFLCT